MAAVLGGNGAGVSGRFGACYGKGSGCIQDASWVLLSRSHKGSSFPAMEPSFCCLLGVDEAILVLSAHNWKFLAVAGYVLRKGKSPGRTNSKSQDVQFEA